MYPDLIKSKTIKSINTVFYYIKTYDVNVKNNVEYV